MSESNEITPVLNATRQTESNSSDQLFSQIYGELHKLASAKLKQEKPGQTLQPTALVHEVFIRLVAPNEQKNWDGVAHFFSAASNAMRRILIENARKKQSLKRGGDCTRVEIAVDELALDFDDEHLIRLDEALEKLAVEDPVKAKLIEMRFFGGLSVEQTCKLLGISRATAHRYWTSARAWLFLQMRDSSESRES